MKMLKTLGTIMVISILRISMKIRGKKIVPIKWYDGPAEEIMIKRR